MNCHATRAVLDLHAEERLSAGRMKSVAMHLESCAACRERTPISSARVNAPAGDFKARLAAAMRAERKAPRAVPTLELTLWPRDLSGVAIAAAALALAAVLIGWTGVPTQRDISGDAFAAGRMP